MIEVANQNGSYTIEFLSIAGILDQLPDDCICITDENVAAFYPEFNQARTTLVVTPGEASKSLDSYSHLLAQLAKLRAKRSNTLVALGGGVIGDLAGFVAATYMRGVPFIQVPTTLLAMVDSSVGGKVGIDLPEGKNLVGAFYSPKRVLVSVDFLGTLPKRQLRNGMAEVWKYAFIMDEGLIPLLATTGQRDVTRVVERCVQLKKQVVEEDEFETIGRRAILNFGHTIGHAIEKLTGFSSILHGEAISIGMRFEALLGERLNLTQSGTADAITDYLRSEDLPVDWPAAINAEDLLDAMRVDKKAVDDQLLSFSLLTSIGHCKLVHGISPASVREVISEHEEH